MGLTESLPYIDLLSVQRLTLQTVAWNSHRVAMSVRIIVLQLNPANSNSRYCRILSERKAGIFGVNAKLGGGAYVF